MNKIEVSFSNEMLNWVYGAVLFWFYLFCLRDINQIRQVGSIPLVSLFTPLFLYITLDLSNLLIFTVLIANFITQIWIGHDFRKEYQKLISREFWKEIKDPNPPHNASVLKSIGFTIDNTFLMLVFFSNSYIFTNWRNY